MKPSCIILQKINPDQRECYLSTELLLCKSLWLHNIVCHTPTQHIQDQVINLYGDR
jgi:hypothetical protein